MGWQLGDRRDTWPPVHRSVPDQLEFGLNGFIFIFKIFSLQAEHKFYCPNITLLPSDKATPMLLPFTVAAWSPRPVLKPHSPGWVLGTPWELGHTGGQLLIRIVSHR